jgi:hypothetical protein
MANDQLQRRRLFAAPALLLALVVLAAISIWAFDYSLKRRAIRDIEALRGAVYFNDSPLDRPAAPRSYTDELKHFAGFRRPTRVYLAGRNVTDATVDDCVRALGTLETVALTNVAVSDEALLRLASLRSLKDIACTRDARHHHVFNELSRPTQIDFTDVPLVDGLEYLADFHGVGFALDHGALAAAKLSGDLPISYKSPPQITLDDALDRMLGPHGLAWIVRGGSVVVTTPAAAQKSKRTADELRRRLPNLKEVRIDAN